MFIHYWPLPHVTFIFILTIQLTVHQSVSGLSNIKINSILTHLAFQVLIIPLCNLLRRGYIISAVCVCVFLSLWARFKENTDVYQMLYTS